MGVSHADSGAPLVVNGGASEAEGYCDLGGQTRAISLRNLGGESLWISWDRVQWFDVPSGTSFGSHAVVAGFWHCTQIGETWFVVNRVDLDIDVRPQAPSPQEAV